MHPHINDIMQQRTKFRDAAGSVLFALSSVAFGCLLLVLNGGVIAALYYSMAENGPGWMKHHSFAQFALFAGPVLLLVFQWSLIDLVGRSRAEDRRLQQARKRNADVQAIAMVPRPSRRPTASKCKLLRKCPRTRSRPSDAVVFDSTRAKRKQQQT
ncbi:MAG: hypothetical protein R3C05_17490 [Pirellulaceae bacterium]